MSDDMLPTYRGSRSTNGCPNDDCEASDTYLRVMSVEEMDRIFPAKSELPITPVPPQATHICDSCGYVFSGTDNRLAEVAEQTTSNRPDIDLDEYDWSADNVLDKPVIESAIDLVTGAPDDASRSEVIEAIERYIPGLGEDDANTAIEQSDREFDEPEIPASEFM